MVRLKICEVNVPGYGTLLLNSLSFIAQGAEGAVYRLPCKQKVIKILLRPGLKEKGIEYLLKQKTTLPSNVVLPQEKVYVGSLFVGYTMQAIQSDCGVFKYFKNRKIDLEGFNYFKWFLDIVEKMHQADLVIGDFKETNITWSNECGFLFLDTDGWHSPVHKGRTVSQRCDQCDPFHLPGNVMTREKDRFVFYSLLYSFLTKTYLFLRISKYKTSLEKAKNQHTTLAKPETVRDVGVESQFLIKSLPKPIRDRFDLVFHTHHRPPFDRLFLRQVKDYIASASCNDYLQRAFNLERLPTPRVVVPKSPDEELNKIIDGIIAEEAAAAPSSDFYRTMRAPVQAYKKEVAYIFYERETAAETRLVAVRAKEGYSELEFCKISLAGKVEKKPVFIPAENDPDAVFQLLRDPVELAGPSLVFIYNTRLVGVEFTPMQSSQMCLYRCLRKGFKEGSRLPFTTKPDVNEVSLIPSTGYNDTFIMKYRDIEEPLRFNLSAS